ncbi:hypothetical protein [Streptomyces sp. NPDC057002]|uniref:hypothetical protein n=1 Tax=Streptomyces sp. NPDC057002 TaxID=3345992 RepID=UPI0036316EF6
MKVDLTQRLDCGHTPAELAHIGELPVYTDHESGESCCRTCSDDRHYNRVRRQYAEIEARGTAEGWTYEYFDDIAKAYYDHNLHGKLVVRAYWRRQDMPTRGIIQPAHMYNFAFKRLKRVVTNSPVTGYALLFQDGERDALCYDKICVITREPAGIDR